jgi:23S rRNA-/tRNA-specific pseudouridylate synthase
MKALDFLMKVNKAVCGFHTREGNLVDKASKSEIRRWFRSNSIIINGEVASANDKIEVVTQLVLFPKSKSRITVIDE